MKHLKRYFHFSTHLSRSNHLITVRLSNMGKHCVTDINAKGLDKATEYDAMGTRMGWGSPLVVLDTHSHGTGLCTVIHVLLKRYFCVVIANSQFWMDCGIPQSFTLGPLLFFICILTLDHLKQNISFHFYAEYIHIYLSCAVIRPYLSPTHSLPNNSEVLIHAVCNYLTGFTVLTQVFINQEKQPENMQGFNRPSFPVMYCISKE